MIILDRDGVINEDSEHYIRSPEEWHAIPGSLAAIAQLNRAGYCVAVATNQSGIGRDYYSLATLEAIHSKMRDELAAYGGHLAGIYFCPHRPDDDCDCRKPKPGLLFRLAAELNTDLSKAILVGDSLRDIRAAHAAGCSAVLVKTGKGTETLANAYAELMAVPQFDNLASFADTLIHSRANKADSRSRTSVYKKSTDSY